MYKASIMSYFQMLVLITVIVIFNKSIAQTPGIWQNMGPSLEYTGITHMVVDPATPQMIYAGTSGNGVFRSNDYGLTWQTNNAPINDKYIWSLVVGDGTLYAGTLLHGLYSSKDGGISWTLAGYPMNSNTINPILYVNGTLFAYAVERIELSFFTGLFFSKDEFNTFQMQTLISLFTK